MCAAMAAKAAKEQVIAARTLLASLEGTAMHAKIASMQAAAILRTLRAAATFTTAEVGELVTLVRSANFNEQDVQTLLGCLTDRVAAASDVAMVGGAAAPAQDYTALGNYVPPKVWTSMQSSPVDFMELCVALGLRKPDARTLQTMSALASIGMEGIEKAVNTTSIGKKHDAENGQVVVGPGCRTGARREGGRLDHHGAAPRSGAGEDVVARHVGRRLR